MPRPKRAGRRRPKPKPKPKLKRKKRPTAAGGGAGAGVGGVCDDAVREGLRKGWTNARPRRRRSDTAEEALILAHLKDMCRDDTARFLPCVSELEERTFGVHIQLDADFDARLAGRAIIVTENGDVLDHATFSPQRFRIYYDPCTGAPRTTQTLLSNLGRWFNTETDIAEVAAVTNAIATLALL